MNSAFVRILADDETFAINSQRSMLCQSKKFIQDGLIRISLPNKGISYQLGYSRTRFKADLSVLGRQHGMPEFNSQCDLCLLDIQL